MPGTGQAYEILVSSLISDIYSLSRILTQTLPVLNFVLPAIIIDHQRHDESINEGKVPDFVAPEKKASGCIIA